jgi:hypothetical protein
MFRSVIWQKLVPVQVSVRRDLSRYFLPFYSVLRRKKKILNFKILIFGLGSWVGSMVVPIN